MLATHGAILLRNDPDRPIAQSPKSRIIPLGPRALAMQYAKELAAYVAEIGAEMDKVAIEIVTPIFTDPEFRRADSLEIRQDAPAIQPRIEKMTKELQKLAEKVENADKTKALIKRTAGRVEQ